MLSCLIVAIVCLPLSESDQVQSVVPKDEVKADVVETVGLEANTGDDLETAEHRPRFHHHHHHHHGFGGYYPGFYGGFVGIGVGVPIGYGIGYGYGPYGFYG